MIFKEKYFKGKLWVNKLITYTKLVVFVATLFLLYNFHWCENVLPIIG